MMKKIVNSVRGQSEYMMKRIMIVVMLCLLALCGCKNMSVADITVDNDAYTRTDRIDIIPTGSTEVIKTLESKEEVDDFIEQWNMDDWELTSLPEGTQKSGTFNFIKKENSEMGKEKLIYVGELYAYKDSPYVTLKINGMTLSFSVSESVFHYLNSYFE